MIRDQTNTSLAIVVQDLGLTVVCSRDAQIVDLWVAGRSRNTQRAYRAHARSMFDYLKKPLDQMELGDLQSFAQHLQDVGNAPNSIKSRLAAIKSLFSFAAGDGIGHLKYNVAAAIHVPKAKNTLNERILTEQQVQQLIAAAKPGRDRYLIELTYRIGARVEEVVNLRWRDSRKASDAGGILTLFGKGSKTRFIRLPQDDWHSLMEFRDINDVDDDFIFQNRAGKKLSTVQAWRIVHEAAIVGGLKDGVSPHWLRHAHASHAIDNGADIRTVQQSLGHSSVTTTEGYVHARPRESSGSFLPRFKPATNNVGESSLLQTNRNTIAG